ncbi:MULTISPECIES: carboxyl transferase domain-containing protein [unclassified Roseateles]|uniref:carboxyl transferase domain-containing protein n=1 Tax=unclassified Roseateles TaxID=2626991 RepID=UPI0007002328|nr:MULTISPECIES: carboxyl transferase domain-containing protein [unclassified Roseateles]KQW51499.1 carbamoyl-phosphate synthase large subunit [Pelomonas sp. Root405]KRA77732.1 carbamoyl-phosphate synthase large subunit [Pelomonas sp. Root662]
MAATSFPKVLVANRGEVALRVLRALHDLGIRSVAAHAADDTASAHIGAADEVVALPASGSAAYLDMAGLVGIATRTGCAAVHPGYGFVSERADFARACAQAGLVFIGATPDQLERFGDKARARALAQQCGVPVLTGSVGEVTLAEAQAFFAEQGGQGVMLKAIGGGGGRGMRAVLSADELPAAFERCRSEARAAFGVDGVYVERLMHGARHVEVQVIGDGREVIALGERDCSLQRRFQKLVEIAPCPALGEGLRTQLADAALRMSREVGYLGLGTFEFLVDLARGEFVFIETNARLQVEHTVTEAVTGLDLVQLQIEVAAGARLADLGLTEPPRPQGHAIQWRINAEATTGRLDRFDLPSGPGVRVDTHGVAGSTPAPHYDGLLAKLIVSSRSGRFEDVLRRSQRALAECRIEGLATNLGLLRQLAARPELGGAALHTDWLAQHLAELLPAEGTGSADPCQLRAPVAGRLLQFSAAVGDHVAAGAELAVIEAMKMEHVIAAPRPGRLVSLAVEPGGLVDGGQLLLTLEPLSNAAATVAPPASPDPDDIRADLRRLVDRCAFTLDAARPESVARRHAQGQRTARENIADLCDEGSFIEYGALAVAAQSRRRTPEDLIANTPADGIVTGIGSINRSDFGEEKARTVVMAYDATVLAGTQGARNHAKTDRLLGIAAEQQLPVVLFAEGGGGRPGDTDMPVVAGLHVPTFASHAALSGRVPVVGIAAGRCFAGNAALLGCSDVIIATRRSNIGMGGPAMVEGGGLGVFRPEQIGPADVQHRNGVIDVLVDDEAAAVIEARRYLAFFQGRTSGWTAPDVRALRAVVPENRLRAYDSRAMLSALFDEASVLFLRTGFGAGIHTALARLEGRPVGVLASNPLHLGGAIDADAADKAARFMQLCNAHGLPLVSLIDTPGFMVGPDAEAQAQVRHVSRLFVTAGALRVPFFAVVLRKSYGLGAMALAAGGLHRPVFTIAWPTGEFGAMGLEGAVRLGYRKELEALPAGPEREALFQRLVARQYVDGEALNLAATLEIDAVIDPADTRAWLARGLASARVRPLETRFVDTW